MGEWMLPYDKARQSDDPGRVVVGFLPAAPIGGGSIVIHK
jgi:hypothetical protein